MPDVSALVARSADTSVEIEAMRRDRLRAMTDAERMELTDAICRDATELAIPGIEADEPDATAERRYSLLMSRRYGNAFAQRILGDAPAR